MGTNRHMTVDDVCAELDIARSTFDDWRAKSLSHVVDLASFL